jgi:hypothetical protein
MTLPEFVAKYRGVYVDFDHVFGAQCVDLIDQYAVDVLQIPIVWVVGAVDWYGKDATFLGWSPNVWGDRTSKPPVGAIVVWGANVRAGTGVLGHVAICTDPGDGLTFGAFSQNYPMGTPAQLRRYAYDGVIGWGLKLQPPPPPPPPDPCAQLKADLTAANAKATGLAAILDRWVAWGASRPQ